MDEPRYYIENGVHRAVAAREAGAPTLPAVLYRDGRPPQLVVVRIAALHVPATKDALSRTSSRYRRVEAALPQILAGTMNAPIEVQPLGVRGQSASIPLASVRLEL
ncbi:hypothetical protein [Alienimonas californiensis]|uniref:ParB/Sulfiredoxin domain-containing protein n=1 Tax=Alienimonas californiensis TaxID=2527989 RepID=A0A517P7G4_9PLAN|nr:hypothetical protein [Alienimonas californiensis]QDT15319.1 hypothetical protein CA12_14020 [Alienimonas californiensis]